MADDRYPGLASGLQVTTLLTPHCSSPLSTNDSQSILAIQRSCSQMLPLLLVASSYIVNNPNVYLLRAGNLLPTEVLTMGRNSWQRSLFHWFPPFIYRWGFVVCFFFFFLLFFFFLHRFISCCCWYFLRCNTKCQVLWNMRVLAASVVFCFFRTHWWTHTASTDTPPRQSSLS